MRNLYEEVGTLDRRCYEHFGLSEDLLMEHAADGMADFIRTRFDRGSRVLIATGSGNNGADGIALARLLHGDFEVDLLLAKRPKSSMGHLQLQRAKAIGLEPIEHPKKRYDVVVDAVLGSGFRGGLDDALSGKLALLNEIEGYKIACDVPSGIDAQGRCQEHSFRADATLTMGALKRGLYLDEAKELVGEIFVVDLGIAREIYEVPSVWKLLEYSDLSLPSRVHKNVHKASFGHTAVVAGEKEGAAILAALSAFRIGSGLVTLVMQNSAKASIPYEIMRQDSLPQKCSAVAIGMGLGKQVDGVLLKELLDSKLPIVADADILYNPWIKDALMRGNIVITPHPKEFCALLSLLGIAEIDTATLQKERFSYVERFSKSYPQAVLLLKGANVIIAYNNRYYINDKGTSKLAKGGSGDVLSGLIAGLLAQGYTPLDAAIQATLIHAKLAKSYKGSDFSLSPTDLIEQIAQL